MVVDKYGSKYLDSQWQQINKKAAEAKAKKTEAAKVQQEEK